MARASLIIDRTPGVPLDDRNRPIIEVARHPHDLERHAVRIRSAQTPGEAYGALVDLFITTAPMHAKLRRLALEEHGALLDDAPRAALHAAVEDGLTAASPIPACPDSLFTAGVTSGDRLVVDSTPTHDEVATEDARPEAPAALTRPPLHPHPQEGRRTGREDHARSRLIPALAALAAAALAAGLRRRRRARARR